MLYNYLGNTELRVSRLCLGTMTFGEQNSEEDGFRQMDLALEKGINLFDTAELYSVPPRPGTYGATERIIGKWMKDRGIRPSIILATKAAGPGDWVTHIRNRPDYSREQLTEALEGSLRRLQTDYIDLYQLHWPERSTNFFGSLGYRHRTMEIGTPFLEILDTLQDFIKAGKVRYIGLSNETPYGVSAFLKLSEMHGLPRMMSIQNPYNLLNRSFEIGLAEMAIRNKIGLLAYSPLAFGILSGKYLGTIPPPNGRVTLFKRFSRYSNKLATEATRRYVQLAMDSGISPVHLALSYVTSRPFVTSNIIGATTIEQLQENIDSIHIELPEEVMAAVERIHREIPNPSP